MNDSLTYQSEGETIGKVSNYISAFKKDKEIQVEDKDTSLALPSTYTPENERSIYFYYFSKFKQNLNNPEALAKDISQRMSRLYLESFPIPEVLNKLQIYLKEFEISPKVLEIPKEVLDTKKSPVLTERNYPFKIDAESLKNDKAELCNLISCKFLSFTLKGDSYRVGCGKGEKICTLEMDMSPTDKMMFELFKEQLGDDVKARKLVILSRSIQNMPTKEEVVEKSDIRGQLTHMSVLEDADFKNDTSNIILKIPKKRGRKKKSPLVITEG